MAKHDIDPVLHQVHAGTLRASVEVGAGEDRGPFARLLNP
jgi:hypothetical protein